ncbi:aldo/keto reductase [Blastococcus sp. PRF04-17]|uniref:aldo/keto reductase n=1 Tax=Blastococcus sp. PRF04-17 TaxID=2933797 RepID=UPI001FF0EAE4|nr:aldo/keto reductase [Blastococcus sp. PRF04-17]UOY00312.1 aldo/keto reductase [Blastococcus sp. PRF04-17]
MPARDLATQGVPEGPRTTRRSHLSHARGDDVAPSVGACRSSPGPISTSAISASAATSSGGRRTSRRPSRCSTASSTRPPARCRRSWTRPRATAGGVRADPRRLDGRARPARPGRRRDQGVATGEGAPAVRGEIRAAAEQSLRRLRTDRIDLYYAHFDDETTPLEETLTAFDGLVRSGKVRYVAASNYSAERLTEALDTSARLGISRYAALQTHYNLMERPVFEDALRDVAAERELGVLPYFALAKGFLTGKYRAGEQVDSPRAKGAAAYVGERGDRVLRALGQVADAHAVPLPAVALRWLADRPTVVAPIASGRNVEQLADLLPMQDLVLSEEQRNALDDASS